MNHSNKSHWGLYVPGMLQPGQGRPGEATSSRSCIQPVGCSVGGWAVGRLLTLPSQLQPFIPSTLSVTYEHSWAQYRKGEIARCGVSFLCVNCRQQSWGQSQVWAKEVFFFSQSACLRWHELSFHYSVAMLPCICETNSQEFLHSHVRRIENFPQHRFLIDGIDGIFMSQGRS